MDNIRTVQTAFRFKPDMLLKAKTRARTRGISLNSYVERLIEDDLKSEEDRYEEVRRQLRGTLKKEHLGKSNFKIPVFPEVPTFTQEELDADPRLEHIVNKYLK